MSDIAVDYDPFAESLWGEYARMLLIGTAACSAAVWALQLMVEPAASVMVIANILLLGAAASRRFEGLRRLAVIILLIVGVVAAFAVKQDPTIWWRPLAFFSPLVTVGVLLMLALRDGWIAIRMRNLKISPGKIVITAAVIAAVTYMIVVPGVAALLKGFQEVPHSHTLEDLSPLEVLRIRSSKLAVFVIFAYVGACVGSFLNVVAASAPRGEPIAARSSACPKCGTPIRRVDNLPIISYLWLGGRCRACQTEIPIRYFTVELVGFAIFAALFLYELITGAANVPGFRHYHYAGILWIILYTKWPVVGVYFLHCMLFSCLLTLALIEQERLRAPRWMTLSLLVGFAGVVIAIPTMLTVSLGDQTPLSLPTTLPGWLDRAATSAAGGLLGWAIGKLGQSNRLRRRQFTASLPLGFAILGLTLGWQAVLTIAVIWLIAMKALKQFGGRRTRPQWLTATTLLFAIAMLHHPAWKWLANHLSL
ncbi:MAG: prepilin peptidase [Blastopirellula sp. JB062]